MRIHGVDGLMPAKHVSGEEYKYLFDHEQDTPTFHLSPDCSGIYTSDMTESAAVQGTLDGTMEPCEKCCDEFPLELHDGSVTEIPLERGGWYTIRPKKATLKPEVDVDELHEEVYRELADRGFRLE